MDDFEVQKIINKIDLALFCRVAVVSSCNEVMTAYVMRSNVLLKSGNALSF